MNPEPLTFEYHEPRRYIYKECDMKLWVETSGFQEIVSFIRHINYRISGIQLSEVQAKPGSKNLGGVVEVLSRLEGILAETPPIEESSRFGNSSFRVWHEKLNTEAVRLVSSILPDQLQPASVELSSYLVASFGNPTRLDYGSGHELHFIIFLYCLSVLEFFEQADFIPLALIVFEKYLNLVRKLQLTYRLEPAGSHGVWGLDDFQFVPYIWGSSQLKENSEILPNAILDLERVQELKTQSMFFGCIAYINQVKRGPFHEHSSILHGISSIKSWSKVNDGLLRMFQDEVLLKFPVAQHILFGSIFSFKPATNKPS